MKTKLKNQLTLGILLLVVLLTLSNCEKDIAVNDDHFEHASQQNGMIIEQITFEDFLNENPNKKLNTLLKSNNNNYRFKINKKVVRKITKDKKDYTSYTFHVDDSLNPIENGFKNLVIQKEKGKTTVFLFTYNNTQNGISHNYSLEDNLDLKELSNFDLNDVKDNITKVDIINHDQHDPNDGGGDGSNSGGTNCYEVTVVVNRPCTGAGHYPGESCKCQVSDFTCQRAYVEYNSKLVCENSGTGSNTPPPPDTNTNSGSNNTSNNQTYSSAEKQIISAVVPEGADPEQWFDDQVFIDLTFKDNECLKSVYEGMGKASTFKNYLQNFEPEFSVAHLRFSTSSSLSSSVNAETSAPKDYTIKITFNTNKLNRPALSIARTFIHEMIHAEIYRKLLSVAQAPNIALTQTQLTQLRNDYPGLYDYYMRWKWKIPQGQTPSNAQHEAMSSHYRQIIEQALREYDNTQSDEVYEALAWSGLMGDGTFNSSTGLYSNSTQAWKNLTQNERLSIISIINTFNSTNNNCQ